MCTFDIETIPNTDMIPFLPEVTPDSRLKDPKKVEADIAKKKSEQVQNMALDPLFGKICSVCCVEGGKVIYENCLYNVTEKQLIENIFQSMYNSHINRLPVITWNGIEFDIPFVYKRAMINNVSRNELPAMSHFTKKYQPWVSCDLMQVWCNWYGRVKLNTVATALLKKTKNDFDVSQNSELIKTAEGSRKLMEYNRVDSLLTDEIYHKVKDYLF